MDINDVKAKIFFYSREQMFNSMLLTCKEAINKFANDVTIHLYHALALSANFRHQEAIRELEVLKLENDIQLAVCVALMYTNKAIGTTNKDLFTKLEQQMRECRKIAVSIDFYNTAFVLFIFKKYEKALDYIEKANNLDSSNSEFLSLKGWIKIKLHQVGSTKASNNNTVETFTAAVAQNGRNLDAVIGLSQAYLCAKDKDEANNNINKAVVRFASSIIPLLQKVKVNFGNQDYDQALECINRIESIEKNNILALKTQILILLCRDSNYSEAAVLINRLFDEMERVEARNGVLLVETAQVFARLCSRNNSVLLETYKLVEKAVQVHPNNADFITELGAHNILLGRAKDAQKYYKSVTRINESSINALMGMTLCELTENGKTKTINQQIEFLLELQEEHVPPLLSYMQAVVSDNFELVIKLLKQSLQEQLKLIENYVYSEEYLRILNPDFLLAIVKECLKFAPRGTDITKKTLQKPSAVLDMALNSLKIITKACPGLHEALFLLAKVQFLRNDFTSASDTLNHILTDIDDTSSDALVLLAQVQMSTGLYERASQSLESALSHNFKVRENPLYHFITGLVEKRRGNIQESIKCLNTALSLMTVQKDNKSAKPSICGELTLADKASMYLELIDANKQVNQIHEATKKLQEAIEEFQGTPEEARIMILSADYAVSKKNVQHAIEMLSKVQPEESYFLEAKTKLAQIYLKERLDKRAYLQCYQEMVNTNPGPDSYVLLGDAYMYILEPDLALESYEKALKINPNDSYLTSKMGSALVQTHHYAKAVNYYKETIKTTDDPNLKLQLANLYMQLKQYEKAEQLLAGEIDLEKSKKIDDVESLRYRTKLYMLLSNIYEESGKNATALSVLREGRDNQSRVRKLCTLEQSGISEDVIKTSVEISMKLAELSTATREFEQAINHYKDALFISPDNPSILAALAKLYMQMNYLDLCQQTCSTLLNFDPENEQASVMMADIAFRKIDFDMALFHFTQLLTKQPTNWTALVRLVEIMKRTGNIENVPQYLQQAEQYAQTKKEAGLQYAKGLYEWYSGNLNAALRYFNLARQDLQWGQKAIYNMIEICLNPDDEMLGDNLIDPDDLEYRDSRSMAIKTAERLLKELKQKSSMTNEEKLKFRMFSNFLLLATKEKHNIETALTDFISIGSNEMYKDNVGPILGMATAYTILKQGQRAKNQLKRVSKNIWTFEDADYLERCWLLLADSYIQSTKYDLANDLLKKVLQHNKASSKAYEYTGFICEKEQRYVDASKNYENAWKHNGRSNPSIGFKLAYNLMKCKKYADAIEICQQVIKMHPDYPRIKKDILDKCINNLRT